MASYRATAESDVVAADVPKSEDAIIESQKGGNTESALLPNLAASDDLEASTRRTTLPRHWLVYVHLLVWLVMTG